MKSVLVVDSASPSVPDLAADLTAVGIRVLGTASRDTLVREAIRHEPDLIVGHEVSVDEPLFEALTRLASTAPRPVALYTHDPDVAKMERALRVGVHAYVVNGYGLNRMRSVLQLAEARFGQERTLRDELIDVSRRFDERKLVDRAKGILMRARQVSEDEAFRVLRTASMHSSRRVGQVSQQVIDAAHYADAVNRAGKLRMLGQRLVKLWTLRAVEPESALTTQQLADSVAQLDATIVALGKSLSKPTFGDLLEAVEAAWPALRQGVAAPATPPPAAASTGFAPALLELDALAELLLNSADQLARHLENAGLVTTLHVINVSGRQRMWSQRYAKLALFGLVLADEPALQARARLDLAATAFEQGLDYLRTIPLTSREIRESLDAAARAWETLQQAARQARTPTGVRGIAESSETLLALFEQLTDQYERSMQVLMG